MTLREGALVRILETAFGDSNEPRDVAARGQLATLLGIVDITPPEAGWEAALQESGETVLVYEDEVQVVRP